MGVAQRPVRIDAVIERRMERQDVAERTSGVERRLGLRTGKAGLGRSASGTAWEEGHE